jgi:Pentapeptide repeats (8 copies)
VSARGNIWNVPDADNHAESGRPAVGSHSRQGSGGRWWSSLWLWPGAAIALAGIASALFGPIGAILSGEAVAALFVVAAILFLSRDRGLTFGLALALTLSFGVFLGSIWLHESHYHASSHPASAATSASPRTSPVDWSWRRISQAMARDVDLSGADLDGANLDGLQLSHLDFDGAQADGASFRGSQLEDASLRGASLRGACLQGANLTGADLAGADFTGADVAGVTVSAQAKKAAQAWPSANAAPAAACY